MEAICAALERTAQARRKRVCCERANKSLWAETKKASKRKCLNASVE